MENVTKALVLIICLSSTIYAGDTDKHSVADVMERHHGLSGPVFFVKANHLMANEKMSQSLGIQADHHPGSEFRNQRLESASGSLPHQAPNRGPSFSEISEMHRSGYAATPRNSDDSLNAQKRYTAFRLEDKATSI